jgi:hypothetical protein
LLYECNINLIYYYYYYFKKKSSNIYGSYSGKHFDYGYGYEFNNNRGDFYRGGTEGISGTEGTSYGYYYGRDGNDRGTLV